MRFGEVFRFEVEYRLRSASTWLYAALLLGLPILMMRAVDGGTGHINSPSMVMVISSVIGMVGMLVTAALFGDAATRDAQNRMDPLLYTVPLRKAEYLGGRFAGALAVNAVLLTGIPLGLMIAAAMPYVDPRVLGPFRLAGYVQAYLLILLPNMVLTGAILFTVAALARQLLPAYLGGIGIFIAYLFSGDARGQMANRTLAALLDPFGGGVVEELTQFWTPAQQNTLLIGYPALLLWNRLVWLAFAVALLVILHARFRFAHPGGAPSRRRARRAVADAAPERTGPVTVPAVPREFGARARAWQTLSVLRRSLADLSGNRALWVIVPAAVLFTIGFGWDVGDNVFGTSTWSVTHLVAVTVLATALAPVMAILIAVFTGELVWKEREVRMSAISDAAPVPDWVLMLGRFLAMVAMLAVLQAVLMASGMLLQWMQGWHRYEPGLYLRILFGIKLVDYVLIAAVALAVHAIVNQKYVGHLVVVLFYLFTAFAGRLGIRHHLLVYGSDPGWVYSDMTGFGPFATPMLTFRLYWAAWALLLAIVARLFWVRGRERELRPAVAVARARLSRPVLRAAGAALALILGLGGFIFYNTNILNEYRTPRDRQADQAAYERRYKRFQDAPQPSVVRAELRVEIYSRRGDADLRGSYVLVNRTSQAIDSLHVLLSPDVRARGYAFDRPAQRVLADDRVPYTIYALDRPLQPGDSLRMRFDVAFRTPGFRNSRNPTDVARNATFFDQQWLPVLGYQSSQELGDAEERRRQGLPPATPMADADDARGRRTRLEGVWEQPVQDVVIGTDGGQIAITTGTLRREWRENGRRYFHYRTEVPTTFMAPVLAADYTVRQGRWGSVALRIFHHPAHAVNVDRMMRGMQASLEYNAREFGPYPFRELRIVEFPRYASFARSYPQTIAFSEGSAFLTRVREGDVDRPFFVTAHETAHQWWGHQLVGADVRGQALVSETLAQYSAMMVMEKTLGAEQVRRFYDYEMERYLHGRRIFSNREVPLLDVERQQYLYYHKGAVAMYTLREHIGEAAVNTALRSFLRRHPAGVPPHPTSRDLYAELSAVTPDSLRPLLHDLFADIVLWDVRAESARVEPLAGGAFRVTLDVAASRVRADSIGVETPIAMNDLVEIGVYAPAAPGQGLGAPLYLRRHRIRNGRQTITVIVPRRPARAGIDPLHKLIQREPGDNVVAVDLSRGESR
jgi:ABC-2 type transport system permease protein